MKYKNLNDIPLFGKYTDPYRERRVEGNTRPDFVLPFLEPNFKQEYEPSSIYVSWLGHSSMFLRMSNLNILIDPIFSTYASPIPIGMLKRFKGRQLHEKDFPNIDVVCITHNHYDHLDKKTIKNLDYKVKNYIVGKGVGFYLRLFGVKKEKIVELQWNESIKIEDLTITFLPTQHSSARYLLDSNRTLWGSFLLKNENYTIYDSGDGGYTNYFETIYKNYGPIDLAIMECGQYNQRWHGLHMFPEESVQAAKTLHAKCVIPVHHSAFILSDHAYNEPVSRFVQRANELQVSTLLPKLYEIIKMPN